MKAKTSIPCIAAGLLIFYVLVYLVMSVQGRYEPEVIGAGHVKRYAWAPYGYVNNCRWNRSMDLLFAPIYVIDRMFWHTDDEADSGKYPINEVEPDDVWRYYQ